MYRFWILTVISVLANGGAATACQPLQPDRIAVLLGSRHVNAQYGFEEFNPGVFLAWHCDVVNVRMGVHRNSFANPSASVSFTSEFLSLHAGGFNMHPFVGGAYYPKNGNEMPVSIGGSNVILVAGLEFTHDDVPLFIQFLPGDSDIGDYDHLWTFGFKFDM